MIPFGQCGWRCVGPCAADVGVGSTDQHALVVDVDHRVGRGLAIDGWSCVVGHAARANGADYRTFVVDDLGNADFYQAGVHGEVRGGAWRALVGSSVFDHAVEAMVTIGQWGAGGEAPVAAAVGGGKYLPCRSAALEDKGKLILFSLEHEPHKACGCQHPSQACGGQRRRMMYLCSFPDELRAVSQVNPERSAAVNGCHYFVHMVFTPFVSSVYGHTLSANDLTCSSSTSRFSSACCLEEPLAKAYIFNLSSVPEGLMMI